MTLAALQAEATESAFVISAPEILLMAVGVVFTFALFALFVIVLRKELRRDASMDSADDD